MPKTNPVLSLPARDVKRGVHQPSGAHYVRLRDDTGDITTITRMGQQLVVDIKETDGENDDYVQAAALMSPLRARALAQLLNEQADAADAELNARGQR